MPAALSPTHLPDCREYFAAERVICETSTAICYDALDRSSGHRLHLWILRCGFRPHSQEFRQAMGDLGRALSCDIRTPLPIAFGGDDSGAIFYAVIRPSAAPLLEKRRAGRGKLHTIALLATELNKLHSLGLALNAISPDTLLVDKHGRVLLNGLFCNGVSINAPSQLRGESPFCAPEHRGTYKTSVAGNVFSLAAYIFQYASGREFPGQLNEQQLYQFLRVNLKQMLEGAAEDLTGLDHVLLKALQWRPALRYPSAAEMLSDLLEKCPALGTLRKASVLTSLDSVAAEYLMSPITRYCVAGITVALALLVVIERASQYQHAQASVDMKKSVAQLHGAFGGLEKAEMNKGLQLRLPDAKSFEVQKGSVGWINNNAHEALPDFSNPLDSYAKLAAQSNTEADATIGEISKGTDTTTVAKEDKASAAVSDTPQRALPASFRAKISLVYPIEGRQFSQAITGIEPDEYPATRRDKIPGKAFAECAFPQLLDVTWNSAHGSRLEYALHHGGISLPQLPWCKPANSKKSLKLFGFKLR